jgi:iron complex outermembrane receptor protein
VRADTTRGADTVFTLEGLRVEVARPVATAGGASAIRASLDSMHTVASPTLDEVLRRVPLIQVRENSRGEAQPQLRGMESRLVAILVDGVPLTIGWDNRTDLSVVPLSAARELTLIRGLSSVLYGPNALGGVVMVGIGEGPDGPEPAAPPPPFQLSAGVDQTGASAVALGLGSRLGAGEGDLDLRAGGGYRHRSGLPLASGVRQPPPGDDDELLNSDFEQGNGYVVARHVSESGRWVGLSSFGSVTQKGVVPELHISEPRLWRYPRQTRWVTALSAGTGWRETGWGEGDLEASVGLDLGETEIDSYESLAFDSITGGETGEDRTLSLRLVGDHTLSAGILRGALTLAETRHVEVLQPEDERSVFRQRLWSLGVEAEQPLITGGAVTPRARVSVGASVDGSDTPRTGGRAPRDAIWAWGARAGGTVALGSGSWLLSGGVSRRVRFPALRELYSGALGRFVVNPNLDPEVLWVGEAGVIAHLGGLEAQAVAFHQRLSDAIVRVGLPNGRLQRQNRDRILSTGVELLGNYEWRHLSLRGDVTLKDVSLEDPTAPEGQSRPEYQPHVAGGLAATLLLPLNTSVTGRINHLGRRYCVNPDLERDERIDADTWGEVEARRGLTLPGRYPGRGIELALIIENITDAEVLDQCGLPQPGRTLRLQLEVF